VCPPKAQSWIHQKAAEEIVRGGEIREIICPRTILAVVNIVEPHRRRRRSSSILNISI
jgi:hypothetical protein